MTCAHRFARLAALVVVAISSAVVSPAFAGDLGTDAVTLPEPRPDFSVSEIATLNGVVYAVEVADLVPTTPGNEVVILTEDGVVTLAENLPGTGWTTTQIHASGETIVAPELRATIAVGDVDPAHPGLEIVVNADRIVTEIRREANGTWTSQTIVDTSPFIGFSWGVRVGDYAPGHPGDEVFLIFEAVLDFSNGRLFVQDANVWSESLVYAEEVGMDSVVGEFDASSPGPEICVTTEMGPTYQITPGPLPTVAPWPIRTLWDQFDESGWDVEIGDVDPTHSGNELVYGTRYSNQILVTKPAGPGLAHTVDVVLTGLQPVNPMNMWAIATGDFLPSNAGEEIAGVDESGRIYLAYHDGSGWREGTIATSLPGDRFYSVRAGELDSSTGAESFVVGGTSGTVAMLEFVGTPFRRGNVDADPQIGLGDVIAALSALFNGQPSSCDRAIDVDADETLALADVIALLAYLFQMGPPPVAPFANCAVEPYSVIECGVSACP